MSDIKHAKQSSTMDKITSVLLYVIYKIVNTLIFIGELTTFMIFFPFRVLLQFYSYIQHYISKMNDQMHKIFRKYIHKRPRLLTEGMKEKRLKKMFPVIIQTSIILHPTASGRLNFWKKLYARLTSSRASVKESFLNSGLLFYRILTSSYSGVLGIVLKLLEKLYIFVASYRNIIFLVSNIILVIQILAVTLRTWIKKIFYFFVYLIILPFKLIKLSFTTGFKYFYVGFVVCLIAIVGFQSYLFIRELPSPHKIGKTNYPLSTHIFDRNGRLLYEVFRDQNRTPIKLTELPSYVSQASIAIEDKDFYHHNGISIFGGMLRALKDTWQTNELQGGSTITQQLIKTALLTPERTVERKIKEVILALWAEQIYTKNQIIEMYLNQIPYGGSAYGIQEAARTYFGKDARRLTIAEAALLAGLTRAPSIYSPYVNPDLAAQRRNDVLSKMYELNFITKKELQEAQKIKLIVREPRTTIRAPHFVFYTRSFLENEYGLEQVEEGGLRVITSLDLEIQQEAERILQEELEKVAYLNVTNGGIIVSDPSTGEILAMVGSKDYFENPYGAFNVTTALRQPGSSLKPLLYSLALEHGYTAATMIDDSPISFTISDTEVYRPVNYDGSFHGRVTVRIALANSYNIPAVKTLNTFGVRNYVEHAKRMGIDTWNDPDRYGLSLSLGGGEVKMIDVAEAYGVFANNGYRVNLTPIKKLLNTDRELLADLHPEREKVLDEGAAFIISDILSDNAARAAAFGPHSALEIPGYQVAVKTGTTDSKKDNWTVGYTPEFVVTVWVGNNDNTPMNPYLSSGITGAAPIWNRVMKYLLENKSNLGTQLAFKKPDTVVMRKCYGRNEYFMLGTDTNVYCQPSTLKPQAKDNERTP